MTIKLIIALIIEVFLLNIVLSSSSTSRNLNSSNKKAEEYKNSTCKKNILLIIRWWTLGGDANGLAELIKIFNRKNPNTEIVNITITFAGF